MNTPRVVIEKLVLAFSIAIAAAVGLAPAIYYVAPHNYYFGPNRLLFYSAAQGAFVAAFYFFAAESEAPLAQGPSALEYLLRALAAVSFWGFLGVIWLIVYGAVYWLVRLIGLVSVWL
ncbi:MAG TPA: hypothetical protein VE056_07530, partial [Pyrinomonadaceae bacterium]|nr:hypothetical protein [Pyrinomonadaceae bacterium]